MAKIRCFYAYFFGIFFLLSCSAMASEREQDWEEVDREGSLVIYRKEIPGSNLLAYKGAIEVNAPMSKIVSVIWDTTRRQEWMSRIQDSRTLKQDSSMDKIEYAHVRVPWPLRDRDFVYRIHMELDRAKKRVIIRGVSVDDSFKPKQPDKIRAHVTFATCTLTPIEGGSRTFIEAEAHGDPKGVIPSWLVNIYQKRMPREALAELMAQVAKTNVLPHPDIIQMLNDPLPR